MTTCANCPEAALYAYQVTADLSLSFCEKHLPSFLRAKGAPVALVQKTDAHAEVLAEAAQKLAPKKSTKTSAKKPLMVDAPAEEVVDTGTSDNTESEVSTTDGPQD